MDGARGPLLCEEREPTEVIVTLMSSGEWLSWLHITEGRKTEILETSGPGLKVSGWIYDSELKV